ncbi:MAG: RsmD family RNA methyltransferase [Planctomycetes bacterium]|nr:RsmD family RNA methyltransferase [Planctomycetota bacterium]
MTTYILAGSLKGRHLLEPPVGANTRPITGLAKKSLFDILGPALDGAAVADLYCGTGTMGLEAISRGAASCRFAERDRAVVERLKRNIRDMGVADRSTVWAGDVEVRLADWLRQENISRVQQVARPTEPKQENNFRVQQVARPTEQRQEAGSLDVVFVDPPYAEARAWDWRAVIQKIFQPLTDHLSPDGIVVLRTPENLAIPDPLGPLAHKRTKIYGQMKIVLLGRACPGRQP